jgi:hypothetical protein
MRPCLSRILICLSVLGLGAAWCPAQDRGISARHHPWGRFQPGAWKLVRVVCESLDERGDVVSTSTTETKTTLTGVESDAVLLEVEVAIEVAGKQFDGQPHCIRQGFHGDLAGPDVKTRPARAAQLQIEDQRIDCYTQEVESVGTDSRTVTTVYYNDSLPPFLLKRVSITSDPEGKNVLGESTLDVVALNMPQRVMRCVKNAACIKTVQKHAKGTVTAVAMMSSDVPGGVVYQTSKETDAAGRVVRRSTLELVDYGLQREEERHGLFGRKRPRARKPAPLSPN